MSRKIYARQGDLLFFKVDEEKLDGQKKKKLVVREGEATDHIHELIAKEDGSIVGNRDKFVVNGYAELYHPDHTDYPRVPPVGFEDGVYEVVIEREHDYMQREIREVMD